MLAEKLNLYFQEEPATQFMAPKQLNRRSKMSPVLVELITSPNDAYVVIHSGYIAVNCLKWLP